MKKQIAVLQKLNGCNVVCTAFSNHHKHNKLRLIEIQNPS
ncbi:hypothetical protein SCG7109_AL_00040 [Chlamydiales bacterium SCGC AG-110-M15]|nr:hypothetical protein SCG7109_AL_00040 [Chlamydiales bacterium SCGC AG-110-M15]